ncbi:1-acyl-sn-glycerol-3-phosphate acyltransferase OS=Streptomyces fumanus OX=67302 GN=GCM10018772_63710 PE=4 SV=1 [Streptomyces fumanus]
MFYNLLRFVLLGPPPRLGLPAPHRGSGPGAGRPAAIVAGNHLSFSDHFLMPAVLKRRITFLAKAEAPPPGRA